MPSITLEVRYILSIEKDIWFLLKHTFKTRNFQCFCLYKNQVVAICINKNTGNFGFYIRNGRAVVDRFYPLGQFFGVYFKGSTRYYGYCGKILVGLAFEGYLAL